MNSRNKDRAYRRQLIEHLLSASNSRSLESRLTNLLTPAEFNEISKRLQILEMLEAGHPQRQIAEELGVGIATVTRGSRALQKDSSNENQARKD